MPLAPHRRSVLAAIVAASVVFAPSLLAAQTPAMQAVLDYAKGQKSTGFLVIRDGKVLAQANWPAPDDPPAFKAAFVHGTSASGALLEDVASQQKSFVAVLAAIAVDKGLLDVKQPVSRYLGAGWSKASPEQEAAIRVIDVLTMSSGLDTEFRYAAPPGGVFLYNTPVYAVTKKVLEAAAKQPLDTLTHDWLTKPAGMTDSGWRRRPAALGDVGNPTGLVTTAPDVAKFGQIVLGRGVAGNGTRIVSEKSFAEMFERSAANPSYGRLWWLNGADYVTRANGQRTTGQLIPSAPRDLVAALGAMDRKLYVSPSQKVIVVRLGATAPDNRFDENLWQLLSAALK